MNLETLIQNMDPKKILTLIYNSSEEVQEEFVERFEKLAKKLCKEAFKKAESARRGRAKRAESK
jgi:phage regulator Rha-like protein